MGVCLRKENLVVVVYSEVPKGKAPVFLHFCVVGVTAHRSEDLLVGAGLRKGHHVVVVVSKKKKRPFREGTIAVVLEGMLGELAKQAPCSTLKRVVDSQVGKIASEGHAMALFALERCTQVGVDYFFTSLLNADSNGLREFRDQAKRWQNDQPKNP